MLWVVVITEGLIFSLSLAVEQNPSYPRHVKYIRDCFFLHLVFYGQLMVVCGLIKVMSHDNYF